MQMLRSDEVALNNGTSWGIKKHASVCANALCKATAGGWA